MSDPSNGVKLGCEHFIYLGVFKPDRERERWRYCK